MEGEKKSVSRKLLRRRRGKATNNLEEEFFDGRQLEDWEEQNTMITYKRDWTEGEKILIIEVAGRKRRT
jgi:hypothetical protein